MFTDTEGTVETVVTGLAWRGQVFQQVFEEAAVDLGIALKAWSYSRRGERKGGSPVETGTDVHTAPAA